MYINLKSLLGDKRYLILMVLVTIAILVYSFTIRFSDSGVHGPAEESSESSESDSKVALDSPEMLLSTSDFEGAGRAYDSLIDAAASSEEKRQIYEHQSRQCLSFMDLSCALASWQKYGELGDKDYLYYMTLSNLMSLNGDDDGALGAINAAHDMINSVTNPDEGHLNIINNAKESLGEVN